MDALFQSPILNLESTLYVYPNAFWPGFTTDTGSHANWIYLFRRVFNANIDFTTSIDKADILLESMFGPSILNNRVWKYSVYFSGEPFPLPACADNYTFLLGWKDHKKAVIFPLYLLYEMNRDELPKVTEVPKKDVCCLISNCSGERLKIIDRIEQAGLRVDYGGKYKNNVGGPIASNKTLEFLGQYKFVLAFENTCLDNYVTEKIVNPMHAKTVPVYFGASNVGCYFNTGRFVHLTNTTLEDCIARMKHLIANEAEWLAMANQVPMVKSVKDSIEDAIVQMKAFVAA